MDGNNNNMQPNNQPMYGQPMPPNNPQMYGQPMPPNNPQMYGQPMPPNNPQMYGQPMQQNNPVQVSVSIKDLFRQLHITKPFSFIAGLLLFLALVVKSYMLYHDSGDGNYGISFKEISDMFHGEGKYAIYSWTFYIAIAVCIIAFIDAFVAKLRIVKTVLSIIGIVISIAMLVVIIREFNDSDTITVSFGYISSIIAYFMLIFGDTVRTDR